MDLRKSRRENSPCERCSPNQPWNERQFISCSNDSLPDGSESANGGSRIDYKDHCNNAQNDERNSDCPMRLLDIRRLTVNYIDEDITECEWELIVDHSIR